MIGFLSNILPSVYELIDVLLAQFSRSRLSFNFTSRSPSNPRKMSMSIDKSLPFTKQMKKATQQIHDLSDAMINAKLGIAMTDDKVWAEGLLYFYEIFKFLEEALDRLSHTSLSEFDVEGMRRTKQFKADLDFWYGEEWMNNTYKPHPTVVNYIEYLTDLEKENHNMLAAYYYHLYVGLFSGGQILRKKREMEARLNLRKISVDSNKGQTVTQFGDIPIARLKRQMIEAVENIASQLGEEDKACLLEESKMVFRMNNKMIRSIDTNKVILKKIFNFTLFAVPTVLAVYYGIQMIPGSSE